MTILSSFEILAENLVPQGILPAGAANPFALQGYWIQVSLAPNTISSTMFNIVYQETTNFNQGAAGAKALQAQYIDANGQVNLYSDFFSSAGTGFFGQQIYGGQTIIYGVQAILLPSATATTLPQAGIGWRGSVQIVNQNPGSLIATPTQRLVYYNGPDIFTATALDAVVYAVPTFTGTTQI